ncbi:hypothetical protein Tco_0906527, partial [Tanacetum coccineum]
MATLTKKLFSQRSFLGNISRYVSSIPSDVAEQVPKVGTTLAEQALTEQVPKVGTTLAEHLPKAVAEQALVTDQALAAKVLNEINIADYMPNLPDLPQDPYKFIVDILSAKGDLSFEEIGKYLDFLIHTDPRWGAAILLTCVLLKKTTDVLIRKVPQGALIKRLVSLATSGMIESKSELMKTSLESRFKNVKEGTKLLNKDLVFKDRMVMNIVALGLLYIVRILSDEREELTDEKKAKLFIELMEKRRKHFAALRAQEKRNRPPTKAQKRTQMSTYLKHMEMKRVNTFVAMGSEVQESKEKKEEGREETTKGSRKKMLGRKRAVKEQQKESSKKLKVEEEKESKEVEEDDEVELKK